MTYDDLYRALEHAAATGTPDEVRYASIATVLVQKLRSIRDLHARCEAAIAARYMHEMSTLRGDAWRAERDRLVDEIDDAHNALCTEIDEVPRE